MKPLALLLLLAATAAHAQGTGPTFGSPAHFTETGGPALYGAVCAGCHMPNGHGAVGAGAYPSLADDQRLAGPDYPIGLVLHGHAAMPPLGGLLSDAQVAAVVDYIRTNFGNAYRPAPTAADVAALR